nr:hypothetical protein ['Parthenium sp.' phyllody phytoplasma]
MILKRKYSIHILIKQHNLNKNTFLHAFTDGRDTSPKSGLSYIKLLIKLGFKIGSISGRYYSMDRGAKEA